MERVAQEVVTIIIALGEENETLVADYNQMIDVAENLRKDINKLERCYGPHKSMIKYRYW